MKIFENLDACEPLLKAGKIGVIRTDTIYGVVCDAKNEMAVKQVYELKGRDDDKSPIILIASQTDMFDQVDDATSMKLSELWPGRVSIIVPSADGPSWLVRGNQSLAYRMPADQGLLDLVSRTGPLIAPSANPQGMTPAMNISEAQDYFGDMVDFYVDGGQVTDNTPSQLYRIHGDEMQRLR